MPSHNDSLAAELDLHPALSQSDQRQTRLHSHGVAWLRVFEELSVGKIEFNLFETFLQHEAFPLCLW